LSDRDHSVRVRAAGVLGSLGAREEVLGQLAGQLDDPDEAVRVTAVEALAALRSRAAIEPLCRALADEALSVCSAAASYVLAQVEPGMAEAVPPLRAALDHRPAGVLTEFRAYVVEALGKVGDAAREGVADLLKLLPQDSGEAPPVRAAAAKALGEVAP